MIIHQLTLNAYGPFAGKETLNFDVLNDAGLFLLNGPTGAGKSSILDALCYALYGTTSTGRPDLRSHFAAENEVPWVELECTISGVRYRIYRSPEWMRPSTRSKYGAVKEHAKTQLDRWEDGEWVSISSRNDEAGAYIEQTIGLKREQFVQVILLPQGEFAKFLNSSSTEREGLLKKLFGSYEYEQIQAELMARALAAKNRAETSLRQLEELESQLDDAFSRARIREAQEFLDAHSAEDTETPVEPAAQSLQELPEETDHPQEAENLPAFVTKHRAYLLEVNNSLDALSTVRSGLDQQLPEARQKHRQLADRAKDWDTYHLLLARKEELGQQSENIEQLKVRAQRAEQAAEIHAYIETATAAHQDADAAQDDHQRTRTSAAERLRRIVEAAEPQHPEATLKTVSAEKLDEETLQQPLTELEALVTAEQQRVETQKNLAKLRAEAERRRVQWNQEDVQLKDAQEQRDSISQELEALEHIAVELERALTTEKTSARIVELSQSLERATQQREQRKSALHDAERTRTQRAQVAEQLQRDRYAQAAFTLAQQLNDEHPCPVCGSQEHPRPATVNGGERVVEQHDIDTALELRQQAESTVQKALQAVAESTAEVQALTEQGAVELATAQQQHQHNQQQVRELKTQNARAQQLRTQRQSIELQIQTLTQTLQELNDQLKTLEGSVQADQHREKHLSEQLEHKQQEHTSFSERLANMRALTKDIAQLHAHHQAVESAHIRLRTAQENLSQAIEKSALDSAEEAKAAFLPSHKRVQMREEIQNYDAAWARLLGQLETETMHNIAQRIENQETRPAAEDIEDAARRVEHLETAKEESVSLSSSLDGTRQNLESIQQRYTQQMAESQTIVQSAQTWRHLADTANGTDADNQLKMTLTTYVLAAQLQDVATSASLHLNAMTHGRYTLEYSTEREKGRGSKKSGLGIVVKDAWHDKVRPTKSLSGGETFMASLALALGLAEVVQHRNGGISIDTLFVDEGFGSLDDSTLEEVMGTLDSLRENGRVIGLISHISEMKNRITTQVQVRRSPEGSHIVAP